MSIKGVIFDVDGTLLDTMPAWTNAGSNYLESIGIKPEANLGETLFTMTVDMAADYLIETYALPATHDEIKSSINGVIEKQYFTTATFKPGAKELLEKIRALGIKMSVATSTDRYCIIAAFERLGIMDYFDVILTCPEVGASKMEPVIFDEAIKVMGTVPEETWVFEDGLYSIKTAKAAGFKIVGVYDEVSESDQEDIKEYSDCYLTDLSKFDLTMCK